MRRLVLAVLLCFASGLAAQQSRVESLVASGEAHQRAGRMDEAARDYEAARAEAERLADRKLIAQVLLHIGDVEYVRGDTSDALTAVRRVYDLGVELHDQQLVEDALTYIANIYADAHVAQFDQAIQYYQQLLAIQRAEGKANDVADTLFNIGSTLEQKGDLDGALRWYEQALAAEQKNGRAAEAAYVKRSIGIVLSRLNRTAEAIPLFTEALVVLERANDVDRATMARLSRGVAYNRIEKYDAAIADLQFVASYYKRQNNPRFLEKTEEELARAYAGAGRWPDAFRAKSEQMALSRVLAEKLRDETSARMRVQFDTARKEQDNILLARQNEASRRIRSLQTIAIGVAVALLLVVGLLALRLRGTNARLLVAQERIARFNDSSAEAMRDVRAWSRTTAQDLAQALDATDIVVYIRTEHDLSPLAATEARPPTEEEVEGARKQPARTKDGNFVMAASGLSGRIFGALLVTGKTSHWTDPERQVLATFAHQLGGALELQQVRNDLSDARERSLATRRQMMERGIRMLAVCRECRRCYADDEVHCPADGSALDTSSTLPFDIGRRYQFVQLLGVGGMGEVFAARDLRLERDIAIKVIKPARMDADSRLRFEREARAVARVRHDHVMSIFDSGELEDGSAFLVTELLHGADLAQVIRLYGRGTIAQVRELVRQGVGALTAVHAAGIIHRDIKPSNLFLIDTKDGFDVKLVDFGIAKAIDSDSHLTHSGAIIGTPAYMAPEQITAGTCDARTDLFAFAAVVYEALTAMRVNRSEEGFGALWDSLSVPVEAPSRHRRSLSGDVDRLLLRALAKRPGDRPAAAQWGAELVDALAAVKDSTAGWPHPLGADAYEEAAEETARLERVKSTIESPPPA